MKEHNNIAVAPNLRVTISLYKNESFPVITRNKRHSSKKVVSMIYTLAKDFFAATNF